MLGKILGTHWELERNIVRTHWEARKNGKKCLSPPFPPHRQKVISILVRIISITRMKLIMLLKAKKPDQFACKMGLQTITQCQGITQCNGYHSVSRYPSMSGYHQCNGYHSVSRYHLV
jgi:hypothetical protein